MPERLVAITDEDVEFLRLALKHYTLFAETSDRHGDDRSAGLFRKQEFYAERFLLRVTETP